MQPKRFPAPELKAPTRDSTTTIFTQSVAIHQINSSSPLLTERKSPALLALLLCSDMPSFRHSQQPKKKRKKAQARPCRSSRAHERALSLSLYSRSSLLGLSLSLSVAAGWLHLCLSLATCVHNCVGRKDPTKCKI